MNESLGPALLGREAHRISAPGSMRASSLVRANAPVFYSVGIAWLLEARAAASFDVMLENFSTYERFCTWLRSDWAPRQSERVKNFTEYLVLNWPELDLRSAEERFVALTRVGVAGFADVPSKALAHCTTFSQSALFYRVLHDWADDPVLRSLTSTVAREDAENFSRWRELFEISSAGHALGMRAQWRIIAAATRHARDGYVQSAFDALVAQWGPNAPFSEITYPQFLARATSAVQEHAGMNWQTRLMFGTWWKPPRLSLPVGRAPKRAQFRAVLGHDGAHEARRYRPMTWPT